ncbi:MAG: hypothetical protein ACHRHE_12775 [Tepidisphaerales bacterium]
MTETPPSAGHSIDWDLCCEHCGYNLRGLGAAGRCPECGRTYPRSLLELSQKLQSGAFAVEALAFGAICIVFAGASDAALSLAAVVTCIAWSGYGACRLRHVARSRWPLVWRSLFWTVVFATAWELRVWRVRIPSLPWFEVSIYACFFTIVPWSFEVIRDCVRMSQEFAGRRLRNTLRVVEWYVPAGLALVWSCSTVPYVPALPLFVYDTANSLADISMINLVPCWIIWVATLFVVRRQWSSLASRLRNEATDPGESIH